MKNVKIVVPAVVALLVLGGVAVVLYPSLVRDRAYAAVGAEWEKQGKLSQADYLRLHALSDAALQEKPMSDRDLDFVLGVLKSTKPLVRTRALGLLERAALHGSSVQKEKISAAIAPSLATTEKLEKLAAERVKLRISGEKYGWQ